MDADEAQAIHEIFGPAGETIPVTALKSVLANSGAGCGTLELAGSLAGLRQGVVPATKNYRVPDPACRLNIVHDKPLPRRQPRSAQHQRHDLRSGRCTGCRCLVSGTVLPAIAALTVRLRSLISTLACRLAVPGTSGRGIAGDCTCPADPD